ncbi:MAG: hypothetical protein AAF512_23310 [Pseudomonadota bacterium]
MKLRQVVIAAAELGPARDTLFELFGLNGDFLDPGVAEFGLVNSVMAIGDKFFEIVTPQEEGTTAGRMLDRRQASCGYMLLYQVDDFAAFDAHIAALNVRKVWESNNQNVSACHLHPKDIGGAIVSFDEMRPPEEWVWGGPDWRMHRATEVSDIIGCTLQSPQPETLAERWSAILGRPTQEIEQGLRIGLDDGSFTDFIHGEDYEGIRGYTFQADDPDAIYEKALTLGLGGDVPKIGDLELAFVSNN